LDDLLGHRRLLVRFEGAGEAVSPTIEAVEIAADLCRRFEGFRAAPYLCPAGVWTLGFGSTRHADGRPVAKTDPPVSREEAESLLRLDLSRFLSQVLAASPGLVSESPRRIAALVDFSYNLGAGRYRASTLRRRVNEGDWQGAREELAKWTRGGGRVLPGLVKRRQAEAELIG
jgi:lysozyme